MRPRTARILALACAAGVCLSATGQQRDRGVGPTMRAVIIDRSLGVTPVSIVSLTAQADGTGSVEIVTDAGERTSVDLATVLAIGPPSLAPGGRSSGLDDAAALPTGPYLELTDGQRWVGVLSEPPAPKEGERSAEPPAVVRHPRLGWLATPLENVRRFVADPAAPEPAGLSASEDTLVLATGDRLTGLIESLGPTSVIMPTPERSGPGAAGEARGSDPISAPGVVHASLANPPRPAAGPRAWMTDGSITRVSALSLQRSTVTVTVGAEQELLAGELRAFTPDASRLATMGSLTPVTSRVDASRPFGDGPVVERTSALGAPLGASDVLLPGPMTAEWELPAGVTGVLGSAELDEGCLAWGDCLVRIELIPGAGGAARVLAQGRLNAGSPGLRVGEAFAPTAPGARLRATVTPGERGPIQDRVVLRGFLMSVEPAALPTSR
jgi:hypothetical protein